jgi:hypothetical protein
VYTVPDANWLSYPLTFKIVGDNKYFVVPMEKPAEELLATRWALLAAVADRSGYTAISAMDATQDADANDVILAAGGAILAAWQFLGVLDGGDRLELKKYPLDVRQGWNFLIWHAWKKHTKQEGAHAFIKVKPCVKILEQAWTGATKRQKVSALQNFLREFAEATPIEKMPLMKDALVSFQKIAEQLLGAKPQAGLVTRTELEYLQKEYQERHSALQHAYEAAQKQSFDGLLHIKDVLAPVSVAKTSTDTAALRQKMNQRAKVLTIKPRRRGEQSKIAPGSSLEEKIHAVDSVESRHPRQYISILYSPLLGIAESSWEELVKKAVARNVHEDEEISDLVKRILRTDSASVADKQILEKVEPSLVSAATTIRLHLQLRQDDEEWRVYFGVPLAKLRQE